MEGVKSLEAYFNWNVLLTLCASTVTAINKTRKKETKKERKKQRKKQRKKEGKTEE